MTFEAQLRHTLDSLIDRLREEMTQQTSAAAEQLLASATAERTAAVEEAAARARAELEEQLRRERAEAEEQLARARAEAHEQAAQARAAADAQSVAALAAVEQQAEARVEAARREGESRGREMGRRQGLEDGRKAGWDEGWELGRQQGFVDGQRDGQERAGAALNSEAASQERLRWQQLADSMRTIDAGGSLSEILDTLVDAAARRSARAGVFLVQHAALHKWRLIEGTDELESGQAVTPLDHAGLIERAVRGGAKVAAASEDPGATPALVDFVPGRRLLALPITVGGRPVAVLYADKDPEAPVGAGGGRDGIEGWELLLEVLTRHAARCLEALTAARTSQVLTAGAPGGPGSGAPMARQPLGRGDR